MVVIYVRGSGTPLRLQAVNQTVLPDVESPHMNVPLIQPDISQKTIFSSQIAYSRTDTLRYPEGSEETCAGAPVSRRSDITLGIVCVDGHPLG